MKILDFLIGVRISAEVEDAELDISELQNELMLMKNSN